MRFERDKHHRRSIRLKGYDYTWPGTYFVTIVTKDRACLFGQIVDWELQLNDMGRIVEQCWSAIPRHFTCVRLDAFVVMPNHVHGIVWIDDGPMVGARHAVPLRDGVSHRRERFGSPVPGSISTIIRSFKSAATKRINEMRGTPSAPVWQRN